MSINIIGKEAAICNINSEFLSFPNDSIGAIICFHLIENLFYLKDF